MTHELSPCPFCGGMAITYEHDPYRGELGDVEQVTVLCTGCGARIIRPTYEDAATRWNRRSDHATV